MYDNIKMLELFIDPMSDVFGGIIFQQSIFQ